MVCSSKVVIQQTCEQPMNTGCVGFVGILSSECYVLIDQVNSDELDCNSKYFNPVFTS